MLIYMCEFLSLNNHNRKDVYNYSIKQIFFYYNIIVKIKNKEIQDNSLSRMISNATVQSGKIELFDEYIGKLNG